MSGKRARRNRLREEREKRERATGEGRARRRRLILAGLAAGLVAVGAAVAVLASGGSDPEPSDAIAASEALGADRAAGPGGPAKGANVPSGGALAANLAQASELIDGGADALDAKLAELRGHPVVVNQWGSWCPPCRAEFPFFAESAQAHAAEVAFLGVDIQDDREAAEEFLAELPVPYPSVFDPDAEAVFSLDWGQTSPTTWFIDDVGKVVQQRPGAYADRAQLEADVEAFLLDG